MRPLLIIMISMLIPALCNAQFQTKIYDLKTEKPGVSEKNLSNINLQNDQAVKLIKQYIVDSLVNNKTADDSTLKVFVDSLTKAIVEQQVISTSRKDSLTLIYRRLADSNLGLNDDICPMVALRYRNIIDSTIVSNYQFNVRTLRMLDSNKVLPLDSIKRLNEISTQTPSLRLARNYFDYLYRSEDNPVDKTWFFPLESISHAEYFYFGEDGKQIKMLTEFGLQTNFADNVTAQSEILSGILPFELFGRRDPKHRISFPLKFDLGTTVSKDDADSTEAGKEKSISELLYGGLTHGRFSYPVFYSNWKYPNGKGMRIYAPITTTFNWTSNLNESNFLKDMYYFGEIACNLFYEVDIIQNEGATSDAKLFLNGKLAFIDGGSKFYDQNTIDRYGLWMLQLNGGIKIKDQFTIAVNVPVWSSQKVLSDRQFASLAIIFSPNGGK